MKTAKQKTLIKAAKKNNPRRDFLKKAGITTVGAAGAVAAGAVSAPYGYAATNPIKWRLQTYSGAPLGAHVIKPQIDAFNRAAYGQMEIELDILAGSGSKFQRGIARLIASFPPASVAFRPTKLPGLSRDSSVRGPLR